MSTVKNIYKFATKSVRQLNLGYMHKLGKNRTEETIISQARFLKEELPVRLAGRVRDLDNLPYGLAYQNPVKEVRQLYIDSFVDIHDFKYIQTYDDAGKFTDLLQKIKDSHHKVPYNLALGIEALKHETDDELYNSEFNGQINHFLNKFYLCRIGIRTLIDLHNQSFNNDPDPLIKQMKAYNVFNNVIDELHDLTRSERIYDIPEVQFIGDKDMNITYIPTHIRFAMLEILKNSVNATLRTSILNPIKCEMFSTDTETVIKIIDRGGGFDRDRMDLAFSYLYTTSPDKSSLSGYGHGLPLARLYTRYFGGDLILIPFKGIGTEAIIYFSKLNTGKEMVA